MSSENRRRIIGKVIKQSGQKTIAVLTEGRELHPVYKKPVRTRRKFLVHDEQSQANIGDTVEIVETRPLSKLKSWKLAKVVES